METVKNIILGLLIGIVLCMGFEIHNLKKQTEHTVLRTDKEDFVMFDKFVEMVKELKKLEDETVIDR